MKRTIYIKGMQCESCEKIIKKELANIKKISEIEVDSQKGELQFNSKKLNSELIDDINSKINKHGYYAQEKSLEIDWKQYLSAILISATIFALFLLLPKIGFFNDLNLSNNTYTTAFIIGIVASLSSCMAVVGGFVLSLSSIYKGKIPIILFHISRIISFFILGGLLGLIGKTLFLSSNFYFVSGLILFVIMFTLGMNMLDIFPFFKKFQLKLPQTFNNEIFQKTTSPILAGLLTFILPCGFTQSIQISAIASASPLISALTMLSFALGTLPVLAIISFGSSKLLNKKNSSFYLKIAGFLVIIFSIYNLVSLLISVGIIEPIY